MLELPRRFGTRHILLKELGGGRLARTFLAYAGGRLLALRSLSAGDGGGSAHAVTEEARRFADEARLGTRLRHPNLVFMVEAGVWDPATAGAEGDAPSAVPFVVTEYVAGKSLRQVLERCAAWRLAFPVGVALLVVREILRALAYLHGLDDQGFVHRDVHPGSVLLSYEGEVKLADIGMARWRERLYATGTSVTWEPSPYAAPELLARATVDERVDVYAVGGILWELLTGHAWPPPERTRTGLVPAPSTVVPGLPAALDGLVLTATARDPDQRFATAAIFASQIAALLPASHDAARLQGWLGELFEDERDRERAEAERLLIGARRLERVHAADALADAPPTLPSTPDPGRRDTPPATLVAPPPAGRLEVPVAAAPPASARNWPWVGMAVGAAVGVTAGILAFAPPTGRSLPTRSERSDAGSFVAPARP